MGFNGVLTQCAGRDCLIRNFAKCYDRVFILVALNRQACYLRNLQPLHGP